MILHYKSITHNGTLPQGPRFQRLHHCILLLAQSRTNQNNHPRIIWACRTHNVHHSGHPQSNTQQFQALLPLNLYISIYITFKNKNNTKTQKNTKNTKNTKKHKKHKNTKKHKKHKKHKNTKLLFLIDFTLHTHNITMESFTSLYLFITTLIHYMNLLVVIFYYITAYIIFYYAIAVILAVLISYTLT